MEFRSPFQFERGTLFELLCESYAGLLEDRAAWTETYQQRWRQFDDFVFDHPDSITRLLVSCLDEHPIGFVSWDPRRLPQAGWIGQNCIVPSQRGKGYGSRQIRQAVASLTGQRATRIVVETGIHPFFAPARAMYLSCGFAEVSRTHSDQFGGMELVRYELTM